jgi:tetratricopeptide (TPR) repeat protein
MTKHKILTFEDINFKLAVIQVLMYENALLPAFELEQFVKSHKKRKINIDKEGDEPIAEVLEYFKNYEIEEHFANEIETLTLDGGNEIYMVIAPFWSGEEDYFDIKNTVDAKQFPKLKAILDWGGDEIDFGKKPKSSVKTKEPKPKELSVDKLFAQAMDLAKANRFSLAIESYRKLLAKDPEHFGALLGIGDCFLPMGEFKNAIQHYEKAKAVNKISELPDLHIGIAYMDEEEYDTAIVHFQESIKITKLNPSAWNYLGMCNFYKDDFSSATEAYTKAIALHNYRFPPLNKALYLANRAEAYIQLQDKTSAREDIEAALRIDSKYDWALEVKGMIN